MTPSTMPTLDMQAFGKRLRAARLRVDVTQTDIARACDINLPNLNALERGKAAGVRAETVLRLAWRLDVSTDYLLGRCEEMSHA
jgi:transcriptional regulator with XRE-family HTH domain